MTNNDGTAKPQLWFVVTSHVTAITFLKGYLRDLALAWDVVLVCSPHPDVVALAERDGVVFRPILMARNPSFLTDLVSLVRMIRALASAKPDVVVYATPKASLLASMAAWLVRVPTRVYELWGLRLETASGLSRTILWAFERLTTVLSTHVVANSESLAARAIQVGVATRERIAVLGAGSSHGVDTERYSPSIHLPEVDDRTAHFLASTEGTTIGYVGRLHPDKGLGEMMDAVELCARGGTEVRLLLVGGDEGVDRASLERPGVPICFAGAVSDVRPYLAAMDVLVLLSLREGFPNVVLEAAAMNVPAVVSNSTGTIDSVVDGVTGFVVDAHDSPHVAMILTELCADVQKREMMGVAARHRAERDYSQAQVWALHGNHFEEALREACAD